MRPINRNTRGSRRCTLGHALTLLSKRFFVYSRVLPSTLLYSVVPGGANGGIVCLRQQCYGSRYWQLRAIRLDVGCRLRAVPAVESHLLPTTRTVAVDIYSAHYIVLNAFIAGLFAGHWVFKVSRVGSGRVRKCLKSHWSGRVKRFLNLAGRVRSDQKFSQSHGSGRVRPTNFQTHGSGQVGSGVMKRSRVGSGHDP